MTVKIYMEQNYEFQVWKLEIDSFWHNPKQTHFSLVARAMVK